jgi:serine/threonine protein kinase
MTLVLFSNRDNCWKLADFGSAAEATSKRLVTTRYSRGTQGYRAPEVLNRSYYNKKADIFALGCVIYETITYQKLFRSDWDIANYATDTVLDMAQFDNPMHRFRLAGLIEELIAVQPEKRPMAREVRDHLCNLRYLAMGGSAQRPDLLRVHELPEMELESSEEIIPRTKLALVPMIGYLTNVKQYARQYIGLQGESLLRKFILLTTAASFGIYLFAIWPTLRPGPTSSRPRTAPDHRSPPASRRPSDTTVIPKSSEAIDLMFAGFLFTLTKFKSIEQYTAQYVRRGLLQQVILFMILLAPVLGMVLVGIWYMIVLDLSSTRTASDPLSSPVTRFLFSTTDIQAELGRRLLEGKETLGKILGIIFIMFVSWLVGIS